MGIQLPNHRRLRCQQKGGVVDVGSRLTDDIKEFSHKMEVVSDSVEKGVNINGCLNLVFG